MFVSSGKHRIVTESSVKMRAALGEDSIVADYDHSHLKVATHASENLTPKMMEVIYFEFDIDEAFSLNITFKVFNLSKMCIERPLNRRPDAWETEIWSSQLENREYVVMYLFKASYRSQRLYQVQEPYYYCHQRAKWSVYVSVKKQMHPHLEFSTCSVCLRFQSHLVFAYQIMERGVSSSYRGDSLYATTGREPTRKKYPYAITCIHHLKSDCYIQFLRFFVRVEKYHNIRIHIKPFYWTYRTKGRVFHMHHFNHEAVVAELQGYYSHLVENFHAFLQVLYFGKSAAYMQQFSWDFVLNYKCQSLNEWIFNLTHSQKSSIYFGKNYKNEQRFMRVALSDNTSHYPTVLISEMNYTGWTSYSCMYGGLSLHESNVEILSLCNNYTENLNNSEYFEYQSSLDLPPFTASSQEFSFVLRSSPGEFVSVNMSITFTKCRGIFQNPCLKHTLPAKYGSEPFEQKLVKGSQTCVSFQFSMKFFPDTTAHDSNQAANDMNIVASGCTKVYNLGGNKNNLCTSIHYLHILRVSNYFIPPLNETYIGNSFIFFNKVDLGPTKLVSNQSYVCEESFDNIHSHNPDNILSGDQNEWLRGSKVYSTFANASQAKSVFEFRGQFTTSDLTDHLALEIKPFSESVTIVSLGYFECKPENNTRRFYFDSIKEAVCLRKEIEGIMQYYNTLELGFGDVTEIPGQTDCIGTIELQSVLCVHKCWVDQLYYMSVSSSLRYIFTTPYSGTQHRDKFVCPSLREQNTNESYSCKYHEKSYAEMFNRWDMCDQLDYNYGQKKLIWNHNVTHRTLQSVYNHFLVEIPGKLVNAEFMLHNQPAQEEWMFMYYRWESKPKIAKVGKSANDPIFRLMGWEAGHGRRKSGNVTWYEAQKMCQDWNRSHLPSFTSHQELTELTDFMKMMHHSGFIPNIFIGLLQQVNCYTIDFLCCCKHKINVHYLPRMSPSLDQLDSDQIMLVSGGLFLDSWWVALARGKSQCFSAQCPTIMSHASMHCFHKILTKTSFGENIMCQTYTWLCQTSHDVL